MKQVTEMSKARGHRPSMAAGCCHSIISKPVTGNALTGSLTTRKKRRQEVKRIIHTLDAMIKAEQHYIQSAPANLQSAPSYEAAEDTISVLEEAAMILDDAY